MANEATAATLAETIREGRADVGSLMFVANRMAADDPALLREAAILLRMVRRELQRAERLARSNAR